MKHQTSLFLGFFLLLLLPVVAQEPALLKLPDTPAARLIEAYVQAFNTGKVAIMQEFYAKHDARLNSPETSDPEATEKLQMMMQKLGELKVHRVVESQPLALRVFLATSKGQWLAVSCEAKADAPDKLILFRLDLIPKPTEEK